MGFLGALRTAGVCIEAALVRQAEPTVSGGAEQMLALLDCRPRPTAILTTDNVMTIGAFGALQESGVAIPGGISFFGFDDLDWTGIVSPPLSVVAQPVLRLGATAGRLLLERIRGHEGPPQTVTLATRLVLRESVRSLRAASEVRHRSSSRARSDGHDRAAAGAARYRDRPGSGDAVVGLS